MADAGVIRYDRARLVEVITFHWRRDSNEAACGCGWGELGRSHPEHVVDVYEQSMVAVDRPGVVPSCAGRVAVAHDRTPMDRTTRGWVCGVCGESLADERLERQRQEREGGRAFCAGRVAVAHDRTPMDLVDGGWLCPVCGEFWSSNACATSVILAAERSGPGAALTARDLAAPSSEGNDDAA